MSKKKSFARKKRAQASMEFLMTYGWSILVVLTVLGILTYFVITKTSMCGIIPERAYLDHFNIVDHQFTGSDSTVANSFYVKLSSKIAEPLIIKRLQIFKEDQYCGETVGDEITVTEQDSGILVGGPLSGECTKKIGKCYKYDIIMTYSKQYGLNKTDKGFISGVFTSHEAYSITGWERTEFNGDVTKEESNSLIGSYEGNCPGVPPLDIADFVTFSGTIYWDLPQEGRCYSSQAASKGFSSAYCNINVPYLAHGWVTTELEVTPMLEGHDFYLIGDAKYLDENEQQRYDGICINDNLYFYVNGNLIDMGGTTGIQSNDNILDPGEEVLRNCDGCYDIDSSAWCIPPVKLSTAGANFKYDEPNTIMVLVEDFCFPSGYAHAGGLKPFRFYFVE